MKFVPLGRVLITEVTIYCFSRRAICCNIRHDFLMNSEESLHKKPRMDEDKDITEDVEPIKVVSSVEISHIHIFTGNDDDLTNFDFRL